MLFRSISLPSLPSTCVGASNPVFTATGATTYSWSGATTSSGNTATVSASAEGTYIVTVTGTASGCTAQRTASVVIEDGLGTVILAAASTNAVALNQNCDDANWTYYSDPSDHKKLLFGIEWATDGSLSTLNAAAKALAEVKIEVRPSGAFGQATASQGVASEGTWTMKRWWTIHVPTGTTIDEPVNVQFFYDAQEVIDLKNIAATYQNANCSNPYPGSPLGAKCGYEGFQWFKISGVYSQANLNASITESEILSPTQLTNSNTSGADIDGQLYAQFNGLTSFSTGTGVVGVGHLLNPLPITILSFTGKINGTANDLYWKTASELNSKLHLIERSVNGRDNWTEVGRRAGAGTTNTIHDYTLTDQKPYPKTYYRLLNIDNDGSSQYSNVIMLERRKGSVGSTEVYPNPTTGEINVAIEAEQQGIAKLQVIDELGRVLQTTTITTQQGINQTTLDLSNLPNAMYMLSVEIGEVRTVVKIAKTQ